MSNELKDELTELQGVGDATADSVLEVLAEHDAGTAELPPLVEKAIDAAEAGDDRQAAIFLRRSQQ